MFEYHPDFETPEAITRVWRYMDFPSFVWVLQNSALWFSRADHFEDKWEGAYPERTVTALKDSESRLNWDFVSKHNVNVKKTIFINCWYAKPYESAAMWQQYAGQGHSIAVRSSVSHLKDGVSQNLKSIHIGKVGYIDYSKDSIRSTNIFAPYLRKRKSFEHESEVRMIIWAAEGKNSEIEDKSLDDDSPLIQNAPPGVSVNVCLSALIETVYVSPKAKPWFVELVREVVSKYELDFPVRQSDFDSSPPY